MLPLIFAAANANQHRPLNSAATAIHKIQRCRQRPKTPGSAPA